MVISSEVVLKELAIHKIVEGGFFASSAPVRIQSDHFKKTIVRHFFKSFRADERFQFDYLEENEIFGFVSEIFSNPSSLFENSLEIGKILSAKSNKENIKSGEVIVVLFEDCVIDDQVTDAVGIFKVEKKQTFLKIIEENNVFALDSDEGIAINKMDRGVMIFNTEHSEGYRCLMVDNNRSDDSNFWKDNFLKLTKIKDDYYQTQHLINNVQEFAQSMYQDNDVEKIALINESIEYIKSNDFFNNADFSEKILQDPELIDHFENFRTEKLVDEPELNLEHFEVSKPAIKDTKRFIRSIIKLDKNFHVYVHGNREQIQKGYDEDKKKSFYTLYFDEET